MVKPLRILRKERDMTQEELAALAGVSVPSLSLWENGRRMPEVPQVEKLAKVFALSVDEMILCLRASDKKKRIAAPAHTPALAPTG